MQSHFSRHYRTWQSHRTNYECLTNRTGNAKQNKRHPPVAVKLKIPLYKLNNQSLILEASFEGLGSRRPSPREKKKKKRKKKEKREKREKRKKRKKGTKNIVKLLHIKCCYFQFFNSPGPLEFFLNCPLPKKKLKWRPCFNFNFSIENTASENPVENHNNNHCTNQIRHDTYWYLENNTRIGIFDLKEYFIEYLI